MILPHVSSTEYPHQRDELHQEHGAEGRATKPAHCLHHQKQEQELHCVEPLPHISPWPNPEIRIIWKKMPQQDVYTSPSLSAGPCCHLIPPDGCAVLLVVPASDAELHTSGSCHADAQGNRLFNRFLNLVARKAGRAGSES